MCLICVEYEKNKITLHEAYKNLGEMRETISIEHANEVETMLDYDWEIQLEDNYVWDEIPFGD